MRILIAPNAFKNSLNATDVAYAIRDGLVQSNLHCTCECFPIGDGGDGTGELIVTRCEGEIVMADVHDALGRNVRASFGLIDAGATAIIEMANASGLRLLHQAELDPLKATSFGTGQQFKMALERGAKKIIIGMGGSATVDGGIGILTALGIRFLDAAGEGLQGMPGTLDQLSAIDLSNLDQRVFDTEIIVLCDVDNFLLGEYGAAAIFGPQKGASPAAVLKLDACLKQLADVTMQQTGKNIAAIKSGGTAGGAAAGLFGFLDAKLVNGIDYFLQLTNFDQSLEQSDLVITGEGSIDEQTLQGKGPFGVAFKAKSKGLPVIAIAGKVPLLKDMNLQQHFNALFSIGHEPGDMATAMKNTSNNITRTSWEIGNLLAIRPKQ